MGLPRPVGKWRKTVLREDDFFGQMRPIATSGQVIRKFAATEVVNGKVRLTPQARGLMKLIKAKKAHHQD